MDHCGGAQGQENSQNNAKTPFLVTCPTEKLKPKTKFFFRFWLQDLLNPKRVWTALSFGELKDCKLCKKSGARWTERVTKVGRTTATLRSNMFSGCKLLWYLSNLWNHIECQIAIFEI